MSEHRFFLVSPVGPVQEGRLVRLPLSDADMHHVVHVLRARSGEELVAVDPDGTAHRVRVERVAGDGIDARVLTSRSAPREPRVTLVQGLTKGDKMDLVVEKAVEVGVSVIVPAVFERSVTRLTPERARARLARWRRVATSAAKQSLRAFVPEVREPVGLQGVCELVGAADVALVCWEEEARSAPGIGEALRDARMDADATVLVVVGPEGGLTAEEVAGLRSAGATTVSLGETTIRTETAGILAVALCVYESGGLGGRVRG